MNRNLNFIDSQRFDTPDIDFLNSSIEDEFKHSFNRFLSPRNCVVDGFEMTSSVLVAHLSRTVPRVCKDGTGLMFVDEALSAVTLDYVLLASATNYVQARLTKADEAYQLRAFFDVDTKEEFHKFTYAESNLRITIEVNQIGYDSDAVKLYRFETDGTGVVTTHDDRVFAFEAQDHTWASPRTDKDITTQEIRNNAESAVLKEIKGTASWVLSPVTNLQRIHDISIASIDAQSSAIFNSGALSIPQFTIVMPNKSFDYTIGAVSSIAMANGDSLYVEFPLNAENNFDTPSGNLTAVNVDSSNYPNDSKYFLICTRVGNNILFGKGNLKLADYSSEFNITDGQSATKAISILDEKLREVQNVLVAPVYNEEVVISSGIDVIVTLPNNSRNANQPETYEVGTATLVVMKDGQDMRPGEDYDEIDNGGGIGNTIKLFKVQDNSTVIVFRKSIGGGASVNYIVPGGVDGENYGSTGIGVYRSKKDGYILQFKRLKMGSNISITDDGDSITISASGVSGDTITRTNKDSEAMPFMTPVVKGVNATGIIKTDADVLATSRFYGFTIESTDIDPDASGLVQTTGRITGGAAAIRARFPLKTFNDGGYIFIGETKGEIMSEEESYDDESYAVVKCGQLDADDIVIINDFTLDNI